MGIGVSVFLIAVGAIMAFAVEVQNSNGFDLNTVGFILMIAGAIGLVFTAIIWGPRTHETRETVVEGRPVRRRHTVVEDV
jgi:phosphate/sulfate permease